MTEDHGGGSAAGPDDPEVALIAAVAANGVIGADGEMPWHYPADLAHFRRVTTGHPVILGRRTYEAVVDRLGGPLPDRTNVVLSRSDLDLPEGAVQARSVAEALDIARATGSNTVYVAGGATVYEQFLPVADRLVLTEIHEPHEGDTRFPDWDREQWREVARDERDALAFVEYVRR